MLFRNRRHWHGSFGDDDCATDEDAAHSCLDVDSFDCCGSFTLAHPDEPVTGALFSASAVSLGPTEIFNIPIIGAYEQGYSSVSTCSQVRASWRYVSNPDRTFPCDAAGAPNTFHGYKVVSVLFTKRDGELSETTGKFVESNAFGVLENGTIYAIRQDSELGGLCKRLMAKMTAKERGFFIIICTEVRWR